MSKEFLYINWRCRTIYNKRLLSRIITDKIRLLLPSSPSSCSSSACANNSYYTVFQTLDNVVDEDWDGHRNIRNKPLLRCQSCNFRGLSSLWSLPAPAGCLGRFSLTGLQMWLLHGFWQLQRLLIEWLLLVACLDACLWPFPISFTRKGSDATDLSSIHQRGFILTQGSLTANPCLPRRNWFLFCRKERNSCLSLETQMLTP